MHEDMRSVWNSLVQPDDEIYNLGDFAFKPNQKKAEISALFATLSGQKKITIGNHDKRSQLVGFGFKDEDIFEDAFLTLNGVKYRLAHFPYEWGRTQKDIRERPNCMTSQQINPETKKIYPLLCGHVHDTWCIQPYCLNVGWDIWKRPISADEISQIYQDTDGFTANLEKYNQGFGGGHE